MSRLHLHTYNFCRCIQFTIQSLISIHYQTMNLLCSIYKSFSPLFSDKHYFVLLAWEFIFFCLIISFVSLYFTKSDFIQCLSLSDRSHLAQDCPCSIQTLLNSLSRVWSGRPGTVSTWVTAVDSARGKCLELKKYCLSLSTRHWHVLGLCWLDWVGWLLYLWI